MMMKTSFAFNLFFIAFHGSYMGIVALGPAYSPSSHTQTQVLTNYGQQEVVRMKLNKQNSLTYPNKFGVSTGSKVGPTTNNAETQYAQTNYAANNPKHIVLTGNSEPEMKKDHSKMVDELYKSVEQHKKTSAYKNNRMFTITTFPNYPSPTNTEQLDRSQKNSPTNNPHSEPEMAKDGENSLSTVLKVKSAESQAHIQSEPVAEKRGDHGQTHSQAAIDPKSYIPMAETGAAKPKIHAEINPTRTLDQKAGEEHKTAHQSEADTCKPRPLEENRLKFSRHESKISADSDPQSNHPESEPKEQATKQVAGQHLATTVDRDHAAHPLTVDMAEPKAVQEKLHELAKPALPELSQPIEELEKIPEVDTHTSHLNQLESETVQELGEEHKQKLQEIFEPQIEEVKEVKTEEEKLAFEQEKERMREQRKKTAELVEKAVTEVVDKLSGVVAKQVVVVISQSGVVPANALLPIEMAMAKFGKEWAPKLGKNAYNTVMEFNVEEVKNNIQLIRERGNLKQLAADLSGKSFEVGTAFLMQKLGEYSSKLAKKYAGELADTLSKQLQKKINGLGLPDLGEEARKLMDENKEQFQVKAEKAMQAFNPGQKLVFFFYRSQNVGSKLMNKFGDSVKQELGLDTQAKIDQFLAGFY